MPTKLTQTEARMLAYDWHSGSGSPLYQFASTGGVVHSKEHRMRLIWEVDGCIKSEYELGFDAIVEELESLRDFVKQAPLNAEPAPFPEEVES